MKHKISYAEWLHRAWTFYRSWKEERTGIRYNMDAKDDLRCGGISLRGDTMQNTIYIGLAFLMGLLMAINLPMNSSVSRYVGSTITANVTFFMIALFTSIAILLIFGKLDTIKELKYVPAHLFLPGFIAAFMILAIVFLIPHIGARKFFILSIAGQIIMAIIVSHFGILESPKDPITIKNLIGAVFVITGTIISTN